MHVLMLSDDVYQLDRRITQEAISLQNLDSNIKTTLWLTSHLDVQPSDIPDHIQLIQNTAGSERNYFRLLFKNVIWKTAKKLELDKQIEHLKYKIRDPAHRIVNPIRENIPQHPYKLIIAHSLSLLPLALVLSKDFKCPIIYDAHELFEEQYESLQSQNARLYWHNIAQKYIPQVSGLFTVSPELTEIFKQRYTLSMPHEFLYNACPLKPKIKKSKKIHHLYTIPEHKKIILCQGGVTPGRGLEDFIDAAAHLPHEDVSLVFLGSGNKNYINNLKQKAQNQNTQIYIGKHVSSEQLPEYTACANIGLLPNRGAGINNTMGAPNRLFEYIQARIPILAYAHQGVQTVLEQAQTGWLLAWNNPKELSQTILDKLEEAHHIAPEKYDLAAQSFSWEQEEDKYLSLVQNLLE